jgi:hypothetical protein
MVRNSKGHADRFRQQLGQNSPLARGHPPFTTSLGLLSRNQTQILFDASMSSSPDSPSSQFQLEPSPVTDSMILVCEKCGKKLVNDCETNPAAALQTHLKFEIRSRYGKGKVRCVLTSCLDVCPKGKLTIGISPANADPDRFYTFLPDEPGLLTEEILKLASRGNQKD